MRKSEGEPEMVRIAEAVRQGAMAYLVRQYKVVFMVFFALVASSVRSWASSTSSPSGLR